LKPLCVPRWAHSTANSFASNGECGLKRGDAARLDQDAAKFIRQQWRMWIETTRCSQPGNGRKNSFASNGECGLKRAQAVEPGHCRPNSFASNGECGLKHHIVIDEFDHKRNSFASNGECGLKL